MRHSAWHRLISSGGILLAAKLVKSGAYVGMDGGLDTAGNTLERAHPCPLKHGGHREVKLQEMRWKLPIHLKAQHGTVPPSQLLSQVQERAAGQTAHGHREECPEALVAIFNASQTPKPEPHPGQPTTE